MPIIWPYVAATRNKSAKKRSSKKPPYASFATLSLAAVALALAAFLGVLFLRGSALDAASGDTPASTEAPAQLPAEGAPDPAASAATPAARAEEPARAARETTAASAATKVQKPASYKPRPNGATHAQKPRSRKLIFVIDDAGYSLKQLKAFLNLPFPISIAVLPGLPNSVKTAQAVRAAGKELLLHQPMQAVGGQNPGPGALTLGMSEEEIEATVEANLKSVPGAVGINNHMGSAASADLGLMETVAAVAKRHGIYYLDSRTTPETAIPIAAIREGIRYWERDVFLDNTPDRASITRAVEDGKKRSDKDRPAIMIGHVWSSELAQTLTDLYPHLIAEGFSLSTISRYMVQEASEDDASPRD
jgi:uncharacterized protein